jgi:hypothetical protein
MLLIIQFSPLSIASSHEGQTEWIQSDVCYSYISCISVLRFGMCKAISPPWHTFIFSIWCLIRHEGNCTFTVSNVGKYQLSCSSLKQINRAQSHCSKDIGTVGFCKFCTNSRLPILLIHHLIINNCKVLLDASNKVTAEVKT